MVLEAAYNIAGMLPLNWEFQAKQGLYTWLNRVCMVCLWGSTCESDLSFRFTEDCQTGSSQLTWLHVCSLNSTHQSTSFATYKSSPSFGSRVSNPWFKSATTEAESRPLANF